MVPFPAVKWSRKSWGEGTQTSAQKQSSALLPRGESTAQVLSKHNSAVLARCAAGYFLPENKGNINFSWELLCSLFPLTCPLSRCCWMQVWKMWFCLFFFIIFNALKVSSFRPEQTQMSSCVLNCWGIALSLPGSCRVASAHCCAPANKSVLVFLLKKKSHLLWQKCTNQWFFYTLSHE